MKKRPIIFAYMPNINPEGATDLRFFVPYALHYIAEVVASQGFVDC